MADKREVFTILEDNATAEGVKLPARQEGDSPSLINGVLGLSFKDSAGNLVLPQLDSSGRLPVSDQAPGSCINDTAKVTPAALNAAEDVVTLALTLEKEYRELEFSVGNFHPTAWELVYIDDVAGTPTETVVWQGISGPGQYGIHLALDCGEFDTIGGTGTQNLVLRGTQLQGALSDMRGYVGVKEF